MTLDDGASERLGGEFQHVTRKAAQDAYIRGVSWALWNGRLVHLPAENFIPIIDEENGSMVMGIGFSRLRDDLPYTYYLYEQSGITRYRQPTNAQGKTHSGLLVLIDTQPYMQVGRQYRSGFVADSVFTPATLPIVPLYANKERRSELTLPLKTQINAYDLLKTGYIDESLKSKFIYWLISGYGGNVEELIKIKETAQKLGIIPVKDDSAKIEPTTLEPPHTAHEKIMNELRNGIYETANAFNSDDLGGRASVAVEAIRASQFNEEIKIGIMWHELERFVRDVMGLAGVESETVKYTPFKLTTGEDVLTKGLQGWADRSPELTLELMKLDPIFANTDFEEMERKITAAQLAMGYEAETE